MKGFKSFADPTLLEFEPGVTVVVGPNGSGKSNVVDAIAWVLGAQGPTTVRSGKMEDVVFAGTPDRPALGRAEVSLVIDNSSGSLPVEFTEVTVTRTLYRTGDSEYSLNGVPCRLLDIQELLSDAGVGRQQHVIVAQGQIDQVLNSRAEDRRTIVEEAAGILKFRRRKERAERRLLATEANLTRLQDLQREVRRQLRPLEKQADAAKRHGAVADELRSIRLFLTGQEIRSLEAAQAAAKDTADEAANEQVRLRGEIGRLDIEISTSESQLAAAGDPSTDLLPRVESLRERCRGLIALIDERSKSTERDRGALLASDVVLTLQAELSRLAEELNDLSVRGADVEQQRGEIIRAEKQLQSEIESLEVDGPLIGLEAARKAAEVRGELGPLKRGLEQSSGEQERLTRRINELTKQIDEADERLDLLQVALASASDAEPALVKDLDLAQKETELAEQRVASLGEEQQLATKDEQAWRARVEALEIAAEAALANSGLQQVREIDGVLGVLGELIEIEPGWELAVEAAIGGVLASVVVEDVAAARAALERLGTSEAPGSILTAHSPSNDAEKSEVTNALRGRVTGSNSHVDTLLDSLLSTVICIEGGWVQAIDAALEQPELTVVTTNGDCFGPSGWSVSPRERTSAALALEEARDYVQIAAARREAADSERVVAEADCVDARRILSETQQRLDTNDDQLSRSADGIEKVQRQRRDLISEREIFTARVDEISQALERDKPRVADLEGRLLELEAAETLERSAAAEAHSQRQDLEQRIRATAQSRVELETSKKAAAEQEQRVKDRHAEISDQLDANNKKGEENSDHLLRVEATLTALADLRDLERQKNQKNFYQ